MRFRILGAALVAGALLVVPATAGAHVTVHPNEVPAGGFTVLNVNVPNETDDTAVTKVELQLPPGFAFLSTAAIPGWTAKTTSSKLATPIKTDDGEISTQVDTVTWTADGKGIAPGTFGQFPISVRIPDQAGKPLTFKALQTYSDGKVARWIGAPGSDDPAPQVAVTEADEEVADYPAGAPGAGGSHSHAGAAAGTSTTSDVADAADAEDHDGSDGDGLAIVAIIVGGLGLLAGVGAIVLTRRKA